MRLVALGISYERVGNMLGFAKGVLCKLLNQGQTQAPQVVGGGIGTGRGVDAGCGREC